MSVKTVKIYFSEEDLQDMQTSFHKELGHKKRVLWNTWTYEHPRTREITNIQMYLGQED